MFFTVLMVAEMPDDPLPSGYKAASWELKPCAVAMLFDDVEMEQSY